MLNRPVGRIANVTYQVTCIIYSLRFCLSFLFSTQLGHVLFPLEFCCVVAT
jgi:hypothetical protein